MSAVTRFSGQLGKFIIKCGKKTSVSVKDIKGEDLVYRESHFNWDKMSAVLKRYV